MYIALLPYCIDLIIIFSLALRYNCERHNYANEKEFYREWGIHFFVGHQEK